MLNTLFTALVVWAVSTYCPEYLLPLLSLYLAGGVVAVVVLTLQRMPAASRT